jgi:hypothetical protein
MKVLTDDFFDWQRLWIFSFISIMVILPIFPVLKTEQINYRFYVGVLMSMIMLLLYVRKIYLREPFEIDWMGLFFMYILMNTFLASATGKIESNYRVHSSPIFYFVYYRFFYNGKSKDVFLTAAKVLVLVGVTEAVIGFMQVTLGYPVFTGLMSKDREELFVTEGSRNYFAYLGLGKGNVLASGTFNHFNSLASFELIVLGLAMSLWYYYRNWLWFTAFALVFWGVVITFSRGALLGAFFGVFVLYLGMTNNRWIKIYILGVLGVTAIVVLGPMIQEYAEETGHAGVRYETWKVAFKHAVQHPYEMIFGYGTNYFAGNIINHDINWMLQYENIMSHMHSSHVQIFLEQGVVGATLFVLALISMIRRCLRYQSVWGYCVVATSCAYLFNEAFEHSFFAHMGALYIMVIGYVSGMCRNEELGDRYIPPKKEVKEGKMQPQPA